MKKFWRVLLIVAMLAGATATTALASPAETGGGSKHAVCHVNARSGGRSYYNYIEVGGLAGHFYYNIFTGKRDIPKHGGWFGNTYRWDFVTVKGDYDCDGREDYTPCDEVVVQDKVFDPWTAVGDPIFNAWKDNGDGTFTRTGSQLYARSWVQLTVDERNREHVCGRDAGVQHVGRLLRETVEGRERFDVSQSCNEEVNGATVCRIEISPDGTEFVRECVSKEFVLPYELEVLTIVIGDRQFEIEEDEICKKDKPCVIRFYELKGTTYNCYLTRNPNTDRQYVLPDRFNGTTYMQSECNKLFTCGAGWTEGEFIWTGKVEFKCNLPCLDCD